MSQDHEFDAPNYTQIPNYIIDEWMRKLTHAEFKIVTLIFRETTGYHRREAEISFTYFEEKCGVSIKWCRTIVKKLEKLGWIKVQHGDRQNSNIYEIKIANFKKENGRVLKTPGVGYSVPKGRVLTTPIKEMIKENDNDYESDDLEDENLTYIEKKSQEVKTISKEELRSKVDQKYVTVFEKVWQSLKEQIREVTDIVKYVNVCALNAIKSTKGKGYAKGNSGKSTPKFERSKSDSGVQYASEGDDRGNFREYVNIFTPEVLRDMLPKRVSFVP